MKRRGRWYCGVRRTFIYATRRSLFLDDVIKTLCLLQMLCTRKRLVTLARTQYDAVGVYIYVRSRDVAIIHIFMFLGVCRLNRYEISYSIEIDFVSDMKK